MQITNIYGYQTVDVPFERYILAILARFGLSKQKSNQGRTVESYSTGLTFRKHCNSQSKITDLHFVIDSSRPDLHLDLRAQNLSSFDTRAASNTTKDMAQLIVQL